MCRRSVAPIALTVVVYVGLPESLVIVHRKSMSAERYRYSGTTPQLCCSATCLISFQDGEDRLSCGIRHCGRARVLDRTLDSYPQTSRAFFGLF